MRPNLGITIYERGAAGIPTTTFVCDLQGRITSYTHAIGARFGFESMSAPFTGTVAEALDWLANGLMRSAVVTSPHAKVVWEGYLCQVDAVFGQERRSISLDPMGNRIRVRYTNTLGEPATTSPTGDAASQALYGVKDLVFTLNESNLTAAGNLAATALAERKNPKVTPSTEIATGDLGDVQITLTFAGWYSVLGWLLTSSTSTTVSSTTTQVGSLLTNYVATNNFLATSTTNITASGITDSEFIAPDTSYRDKIESLLAQGNGANRYAWGVYEDRTFYASVWAGATPAILTYQRYLGDGTLYDAYNLPVDPPDARPNAMYQVNELHDVSPVTTAQDAAARFFVERVVCTIDEQGARVSLEPTDSASLDAALAWLNARYRG